MTIPAFSDEFYNSSDADCQSPPMRRDNRRADASPGRELHLRLAAENHQKLKGVAAMKGYTMAAFAEQILVEQLARYRLTESP